MKRTLLLSLSLFSTLCLEIPSVSAENITITTYYPSPRGTYRALRVGSSNTPSPSAALHVVQPDNQLALRVDNDAGGTRPFVVDQNGNVGVGFLNPQSALDVDGGLRVTQTANQPALRIDNNAAGTRPFVIDQNGDVAIGAATPQATLDVAGGVKVGTAATCNNSTQGTLRWVTHANPSSREFQYCNGVQWIKFMPDIPGGACAPNTTGNRYVYKACSCGGLGSLIWEGYQICDCNAQGENINCQTFCDPPPIACP